MPAAARIGDDHACPLVDSQPHRGGVITTGEPTVRIGGKPAAREGDVALCQGPTDCVSAGEPSVRIGGKPAARLGDPTAHGGQITAGCPTVQIGNTRQRDALQRASISGSVFCERCS